MSCNEIKFMINKIPAVLYGAASDCGFLFIHGQCGSKNDAQSFAELATACGCQVLSIDLPEHGERHDSVKLLPWEVLPELKTVMDYAKANWKHIFVRAVSIGAWFSLLAFGNENIDGFLLSSPLLDMENMIFNLMEYAGITEERLKAEGEIPTDTGNTLSWKYLCWVREHPVCTACCNISVLYATGDGMIPRCVIDSFAEKNICRLTILQGGQHWLHTADELEAVKRWETDELMRIKKDLKL